MTIPEFISGVTTNISNQILKNSVTPYVVGNSFVELANIVADLPTGTTSGGTTYTFENGITELEGGAYGLGGEVSENTLINLDTNLEFRIADTVNNTASFNLTSGDNIENNGLFQLVASTFDGTGSSILSSEGLGFAWYYNSGSDITGIDYNETTPNVFTIADDINLIGLQYKNNYSANYTDRSLVDKGYVDSIAGGKYKGSWQSGVALADADIVYSNQFFLYTNGPIAAENNIYDPQYKVYAQNYSRLNSDANNIALYRKWSNLDTFRVLGDLELFIDAYIPNTTNSTFPLFSSPINIMGTFFEFTLFGNLNLSQAINQKFRVDGKLLSTDEWRELTPYWSDNEFWYSNSNTRVAKVHIDGRIYGNSYLEFRCRYEQISGAGINLSISLEFRKSSRKLFFGDPIEPSRYWAILDSGTDPNTELPNWKGTDNSTITKIPSIKEFGNLLYNENGVQITGGSSLTTSVREIPSGSVDGSNVTFTLAHTPSANTESVYLNGLLLDPGAGNDYTISTGTITFLTAPVSGDKIRVTYQY